MEARRHSTGTLSNLMRLLVLQMTVNEMLKNPQHLWHFLDLLKSLKTPRKSFLAAERRTIIASAHFWHVPWTFFSDGDWTKSDPIFCCGILDWSHLRQGREERRRGEWLQSGRPWLRQSVVSSAFDFHAFCRLLPIKGPGKESLHYLLESISEDSGTECYSSLHVCKS